MKTEKAKTYVSKSDLRPYITEANSYIDFAKLNIEPATSLWIFCLPVGDYKNIPVIVNDERLFVNIEKSKSAAYVTLRKGPERGAEKIGHIEMQPLTILTSKILKNIEHLEKLQTEWRKHTEYLQ